MKQVRFLWLFAVVLMVNSATKVEIDHFPEVRLDLMLSAPKQQSLDKSTRKSKSIPSSSSVQQRSTSKSTIMNNKISGDKFDLNSVDFDLPEIKAVSKEFNINDVLLQDIATLTETASPSEYPTFNPTGM